MSGAWASGQLSKGICDRCGFRVEYLQLRADQDIKSLRVCYRDGCQDSFDPWRKNPRQLESMNLRFPRPDVPLAIPLIWDGDLFWDEAGNWDSVDNGGWS